MKSIILCTVILLMSVYGQRCFGQRGSNDAGMNSTSLTGSNMEPVVNTIELCTAVTLEYAEQGDKSGRVVIFLHGYTDSRHSFDKVLEILPTSIHAFAISQRGHGNSSKPDSAYHPKDFAADIAAFIRSNNLGPVVIAGHSMGGIMAQQFVLDYPELTAGLVIIDSDPAFRDNPGMSEFMNEVLQLKDPVSYNYAEAFQQATLAKPIDSVFYELVVNESLKLPVKVWIKTFIGFMQVDYASRLHKIEKPALILWGDQDSFCPYTDQSIFTREIKNSKHITYKNTGHALHWEEPQRFVSDLLFFMHSLD